MKKTFFPFFAILFAFTTSISSCQTPNSCGPGYTYSPYADNGMGGCVPVSTTGGNGTTTQQPDQLHYVLPVGVVVTSVIAYKSTGVLSPNNRFYALCYGGAAYSGNSYDVSTQNRKCTAKTVSGALLPAIADQNILNDIKFENDVRQLMQNLTNIGTNKSQLQQYKDRVIPVMIVGGNGFQKGAESFNSVTGELAGTGIVYEIQPGYEWLTVKQVYGLQ